MTDERPEVEHWTDQGGLPGKWPGGADSHLLAEVRFWTRIMREHAMFIRLGLPCDRPDLIREAQRLEEDLRGLEERVNRATMLDRSLINALRDAVAALVEFKRRLLRMMVQCQLSPALLPLLIDHLIREANHFLTRLEMVTGLPQGEGQRFLAIMRRAVFWMRIMKEHVEFIIRLLDPSERSLIARSQEFHRIFTRLFQTAMDLESMAQAEPETFNTVARFLDEAIARTTELRDFKAAGHELALMCQLLSMVSTPVLLDHIRREADRAIEELGALRQSIPVHRPPIA
ncbi:MAG: DUF2935 domain-containing protein [Firmicutes bacterium]|jgi:hypothetical protein|nr:DUF2935 domain-containing protein [Bacillota bacterium]MDH7494702.1 DUF2935 domain-containing protein [Bacillota bacterium]